MNYILLTKHPWGLELFERLKRFKGNWRIFSDTDELLANVDTYKPRYIFVGFWHDRVPPEITENYECVGFHPSDLPRDRGGSPIQHAILEGLPYVPFHAIRLNQEIDAGEIYFSCNLNLAGCAEEIYLRQVHLMSEFIGLMVKVEPPCVAQMGTPTFLKRRTPKESEIKNVKSLMDLYDFIRMLDAEDYPHAFLNYQGFRFEFTNSTIRTGKVIADVKIIQSKV